MTTKNISKKPILLVILLFSSVFLSLGMMTSSVSALPYEEGYIRTYWSWRLEKTSWSDEYGADGTWIVDPLVTFDQLIVRPEIPGCIEQTWEQSNSFTATTTCKVGKSGSAGVKVTGGGHTASIKATGNYELSAEGSLIIKHGSKLTIDINHKSEDELAFTATVTRFKVAIKLYQYSLHKFDLYRMNDRGKIRLYSVDRGIDTSKPEHFKVETFSEIKDVEVITSFLGEGYDHDNLEDQRKYPFAKKAYEEILAGKHTINRETIVIGDHIVELKDWISESEIKSETALKARSITVAFDDGFGVGFIAKVELSISITGTYSKKTSDTKEETKKVYATFKPDARDTNINGLLERLDFGSFRITRIPTPPIVPITPIPIPPIRPPILIPPSSGISK